MNDTAKQTFFPLVKYTDPAKAIEWLEKAFAIEPHEITKDDEGRIVHAELRYATGILMITQQDEATTGGLYVAVDDPDAHHARAKAAGAEITMELVDQPYGSREYGARDLEGNIWYFGTYRP
ncbi:VOC family protein [Spirillospora sp. CA-294931]|uniref:VOC family protein n=1 Tax=Spirillospora sp. CA-294931 TaxID=3240042 RepID=UPI003D8A56BD